MNRRIASHVVAAYVITGMALAIALFSYITMLRQAEAINSSTPLRNNIVIRVESYDTTTQVLEGITESGTLPQGTRIALHVDQRTVIERRSPRVVNGVITGVTDAVPAVLEDLAHHSIASIYFTLNQKDSTLLARRILVGDPLVTYSGLR